MEYSEDEAIMEVIDKNSPDLSPSERRKLVEVLENHAKGISFKDSLGVDADTIEQLYGQGHTLFTKQKYEDAAKVFQVLYLLDPMDSRFALAIGASFQMAKNYESAIGWYLALSLIDEETPLPFYYISDCFLKIDHLIASHEFLNKTIERCGNIPQYSTLKARATMMVSSLAQKIAEEAEENASKGAST